MTAPATPRQVPGLRRDIARFAASDFARMVYINAIHNGLQVIRSGAPTVDADAYMLAKLEHERLVNADLYYLDAGLCQLTNQAEPDMPAWIPTVADLPSKYGFVCLGDAMIPPNGNAPIYAITWGPVVWPIVTQDDFPSYPAVMLSVYSLNDHWQEPMLSDPQHRDLRALQPCLGIDNEAIIPIEWPEGSIPIGHKPNALSWYGRWLHCAFRLASQGDLTEDTSQPAERAERKRHARAGITAPADVRITQLKSHHRKTTTSDDTGDGRTYRHRWIVKGHWRNQYYPSVEANRPKYIAPYIKGPDGAPMIGGERVTIATPPPTNTEPVEP